MKNQLVWFRNDLRVTDNPALYHACQQGQPVIAVYIATPTQWREHDDAPIKIDFWRRNLVCLQLALSKLNIELHFFQVETYQQVPELISRICQQWHIDQIHFNYEYPVNERQRDRWVINRCQQNDVQSQAYHDQLLLPPQSVRTKTGQAFKMFTPFAKQARQRLQQTIDIYPTPEPQQSINLELLAEECHFKQISWPNISEKMRAFWPAGEQIATSRLITFCENNIADYHHHRDIPALAATSQLSAYLASGIISIRQCWYATSLFCEPSEGVRIWQNELLWREFYKHVLIEYPYVSMHQPWKPLTDNIAWRDDVKDLAAWQQGQTGFPIIDAAMRQLLTCGWMHNRLRMVTAMFLSKHLLIDWRLGERWFMQHLIDGDLAANNGGWQWSASTGTDAVPYFRIFNPISQSKRFDPQGEFIRHYLPVLGVLPDNEIHMPTRDNRPEGYPETMIDLQQARSRALRSFKQH